MFNLLPINLPERVYWIRHGGQVWRTRSPGDLRLGYRPLRVTLDPAADHYVLRVLLGAKAYDECIAAGGPISSGDAERLFREWAGHHGVTLPEATFPATEAAPRGRQYRRGRPIVQ